MFDAEQGVSIDTPSSECPNCPPSQRQPQNASKFLTTHGDHYLLLHSCCAADRNWFSNRCANHFFRAACPTLIEARIRDKNSQVVASAVASRERTRWTSAHIVATYNPRLGHVVKDAESALFSFKRILADGLAFGSYLRNTRWKLFSYGELI